MKGKFGETIKKWWMIVLVATLALSLTSCGRKRNNFLTSGGIECGGQLGDFDIFMYPVGGNQFEVVLLPYEVYADDIAVSVTQANGTSRTLSTLTFVDATSQEYSAGTIFSYEIGSGFDSLVLTGYSANGQFAGELLCDLPVPSGLNY